MKNASLTKRVARVMSLFGGVQLANIACSIVRTKLVALWIGAVGVGLFGLFNSALEMLSVFFQMGIRNSAVRDVSMKRGDAAAVGRLSTVVRRWTLWLGIAGAVLTAAFSPLLSDVTFGDRNHIFGFVLLSIAVLANTVASGESAVLQGMERFKRLAKASLIGATSGLLISVPLLYLFRLQGVVPTIVAYSLATMIGVLAYREKLTRHNMTVKSTVGEGVGFMKLGFFMTVSIFASMAASYVFMAWLNIHAGTEEVGYFQAGYSVINRYMGMVFAAIAIEFYPRLSSVAHSPFRTRLFVSHEIVMGMMVLLPAATLFLAADHLIVMLLYDSDFMPALPYITWGTLGTVFRAFSWCLAYTMLANGEGKIFVITETLSALVYLGLSVLGFSLLKIEGLGIAYAAWYLIYAAIVSVVYFRRYRLTISRPAWGWTIAAFLVVLAACILKSFDLNLPIVVIGLIGAVVSFRMLRKHLLPADRSTSAAR